MISCKSYQSAWVRLLLLCLHRLTWIPISEHHHGSQIRVCITFVTFIGLLQAKIFLKILNVECEFVCVCSTSRLICQRMAKTLREKLENLVCPKINLDSDFTSGEDKHLRYTTCAVWPHGQKRWIKGLEMPPFDQVHFVLHASHVFCCCFSHDLKVVAPEWFFARRERMRGA